MPGGYGLLELILLITVLRVRLWIANGSDLGPPKRTIYFGFSNVAVSSSQINQSARLDDNELYAKLFCLLCAASKTTFKLSFFLVFPPQNGEMKH